MEEEKRVIKESQHKQLVMNIGRTKYTVNLPFKQGTGETYKDKKYNDIHFNARPVYFDDNWKIVAQPFKAVYADYGLFEVDDNIALKSFYLSVALLNQA